MPYGTIRSQGVDCGRVRLYRGDLDRQESGNRAASEGCRCELLDGATHAEIAGELGVKATVASNYKALLAEWRALYTEKADEYVQLIMRHYDVLLNATWNDAKSGDLPRLNRSPTQSKKSGLVRRGVMLFEIKEGRICCHHRQPMTTTISERLCHPYTQHSNCPCTEYLYHLCTEGCYGRSTANRYQYHR